MATITPTSYIPYQEAIWEAAQKYKQQGYQVWMDVSSSAFPALALPQEYNLELVAQNAQETVIVEISSLTKLRADKERLLALTSAVETLSNWRINLVMLADPAAQTADYTVELPVMSYAAIQQGFSHAQTLLAANHWQAAFDHIWDYGLAALRFAIDNDEDVKTLTPDWYFPHTIITLLISEGYLHQEDLHPLEQAFAYRYEHQGELTSALVQQVFAALERVVGYIQRYLFS